MILPVLFVGGLFVGFAVGRWWTLLLAVLAGLWIGTTEEVEVSGAVVGIGYGLATGLGILIGVLLRRGLSGDSDAASP
jgi:hypothetical protein